MLIAGRYDIGAQIGSGGSGAVYRGTDLRLDRVVAIKVIPAANRRATERQLAEIRTMAAATGHPNVVALYDALLPSEAGSAPEDAGHAVLVMELVDGPSLSAVIADGPLPLGVVRGVGLNIAAALVHLHRQGIVHRDIKPANVLIAPDGQAKLGDFGISRLGAGSSITSTGFLIGTAGYLSPEQVEGAGAGPESDIYSLGLVLLEAMTAHREYTGPPTEAALARLARQPAVPAELPGALHQLFLSMVARDRADRPTADDVVAALTAVDLRGAGTAPLVPAVAPMALTAVHRGAAEPTSPTAWMPRRSTAVRRRMATGVAAVAVIGALLGASRLIDDDGSSPATVPPPASDVAGSLEPQSPAPTDPLAGGAGESGSPVAGSPAPSGSSEAPSETSEPSPSPPSSDPETSVGTSDPATPDATEPGIPPTSAAGSANAPGNSGNAPGQTKEKKVKVKD